MAKREKRNEWIDQKEMKETLLKFFAANNDDMNTFGRTVNQTFEAFVFSATIGWFRQNGWTAEFRHPGRTDTEKQDKELRLKFSTRGKPDQYSYAICRRGDNEVHIRHQLRVATNFHDEELKMPANVCMDVAVIKATDLKNFNSDDYVANDRLITFGEAKHMTAFAELVANFVGLVHEMQPHRLKRTVRSTDSLSPFLYVSGFLNRTAQGVEESLRKRGYDLDVYWRTKQLADACKIPDRPAPAKVRKRSTPAKKATPQPEAESLPF